MNKHNIDAAMVCLSPFHGSGSKKRRKKKKRKARFNSSEESKTVLFLNCRTVLTIMDSGYETPGPADLTQSFVIILSASEEMRAHWGSC